MTKKAKTASTFPAVYLRELRDSDFDELSDLFAASRNHLRGFAATSFDRKRFQEMLNAAAHDSTEARLVCIKDSDQIAGQITLSQIFRKSFQSAYLGYQLFGGFTGRGYMTEAVRLMLKSAFTELDLHRIEANVQPENKPSIRVLKRNGFTKEGFSRRYLKIGGRWRDHERWAIIKEDWRAYTAKSKRL
jgi:ribosomal-protein-alanine N-acetyltransferase